MSAQENPLKGASNRTISVLAVIDTVSVKKKYPTPSKVETAPTSIDNSNQFMVVTNSSEVTQQGTANPVFVAIPGDTVAFYGRSGDDNSDDAVIIYGIRPFGSSPNVFNRFQYNPVERQLAAFPNDNSTNGLPAVKRLATFASFSAIVRKKGEELFWLDFALYALAADGETQELFGYYTWEPKIVVT